MKQMFLLIPLILGAGSSVWAAACATDQLATYEGAGFSCTVGGLVFSDFTSSGIDTTTDVNAVTGSESGLEFLIDLTAPSTGGTATLDYMVSCDACTLDDWELQNGLVTSTSGAANVLEQSAPGALDQLTNAANATTGLGSATFSPTAGPLVVDTTISLGGGTSTTTLASFTSLFSSASNSTVPEPSTLILCTGLLGLLPLARRRFAR
jgi:hypothetical protein